ncbi:MAG: lipoprotein [Labilibaculum antarcticum]
MIKRILVIIVITIILTGCSVGISDVVQMETDLPVILRLDKKDRVRLIKFPIGVKINNRSPLKQGFVRIECLLHKNPHEFESKLKWVEMYERSNNSYVPVASNNLKYIPSFGHKEYFVYTIHNIDTSEFYKISLEKYRLKMLELNQDTLAVGSLKKFIFENQILVDKLLGKDSLVLTFDEFTDKPRFHLTIPVEF